ncbi:hypothetical protein BO70DRAFT_362249 [Aspergillus heteromorphus CBS 117.55]|uniref:Uncharacterized protein n=1 Tax=Aspergillus heteromorphus CBS 117.55 TaxID=1448321 RepID=A0A317W584_9EURO|nr:uncharacterized protein BO70DRAFT_362249 [Aspergillus heteromorphus CBS 117.55]PWY81816.1 hypothetical protein BO70DRAFT_362249 [Aspergillus heteromorphus CBS 117.55]
MGRVGNRSHDDDSSGLGKTGRRDREERAGAEDTWLGNNKKGPRDRSRKQQQEFENPTTQARRGGVTGRGRFFSAR